MSVRCRLAQRIGMLAGVLALSAAVPAAAATPEYSVGPISDISSLCSNQNAEVEQAVDPRDTNRVYELWMGCGGIGFARSTDGGVSFSTPMTVPGSGGNASKSWDPAIAVDPRNGTVYASFMYSRGGQYYPVVAASFNDGQSFTQVTSLTPPAGKNWGDRDFIAVGPDGTVYVTWDYGPERTSIQYVCDAAGSCSFVSGDLNVVLQKSTDGGRTFGAMSYVSPGFPASGADSGPLVVQPTGTIDVLYQDYPTDPSTYALSPAHEWFTSSNDAGATWTAPVEVGPGAGTMSAAEWWIDGDISTDSSGNLYASWDTQATAGAGADTGWLSYSTDGGRSWSTPAQAPADDANVPHIVEVAGAGAGTAYVAWLSDNQSGGYAEYLRTFSITGGWQSAPVQISQQYGAAAVWPGDTFGISTTSATHLVLSWGSAVNGKQSEIFATGVSVVP